MANTSWPSQMNYLDDEFDLSADRDAQQYHQQQHLTSAYSSQDGYSYQQQQQLSLNPSSSSSVLQGAFGMTPNQYQQSLPATSPFSTPQTNMSALDHGTYSTHRTHPSIATGNMSNDYQNTSNTFNFANSTSRLISSFPSTSPGRVQHSLLQTLHQDASPFNTNDTIPLLGPQNKRPRNDSHADEPEIESGTADHKDGKAKLARACGRCKGLKVKCEAKTETEPCKRCFNGGYECVIPGKKIRKAPPKREHLLNQIQAQAKEIDRLMRELERATKRDQKLPDHMEDRIKAVNLSPSTTISSLFSDPMFKEEGSSSPPSTHSHPNAETNQAVADWIAKAKESLQEFGTFIGLGGAALPQSYLIEDGDSESSREDDFVDVEEDLDDDKYEVIIDLPVSDGGDQEMAPALGSAGSVRDESFGTGLGGTNTTVRRRIPSESSKPANLPVEAAPFGLFANLQLKKTRSRENSAEPKEEADKGTGIANEDFFAATSAPNALGQRLEISQQEWPAIISLGIITPHEAEKLFKIYFDNINLSVSLLDPILYTASRTLLRSPFLFTVICAISSRFYADRPELYSQTIHYAQAAAGKALVSGAKNVEMCFAYILLSLYPVPSRKWEDQRGWLYLGLAIRTATDLNLHLPTTAKPRNENHAREMLNRTRLWINCFNLDRSTGSQYGKPPIINPKDYTANHAENWWCSSPYNLQNFDIHLSAYNSELKVMANFIAKINGNPEHPTGLNKEVDFEAIATETDDEIKALGEKWMKTLAENTDLNDPQNSFRIGLLRLAYSYSRLIALSYGFQHAFGKSDGKDENPFLKRCLKAASDVVHAVDISQPSQIHYWRHGPEAQSVFVTFASAFLVKLLQPKFASYVSQEMRIEIRQLVQSVIDLLGSPEVAIDDRHGPKLYSRFLEKLLNKPMAISPGSTSTTFHTRKLRRAKNSSDAPHSAELPELSSSFDASGMIYDQPSPSTTHSLSPPPTSAALSFDQFAPMGGCDPFASSSATQNAINISEDLSIGDFFSPPLPFDPEIMQSFQSLTDPNEWYDISFPAQFTDFKSNWMTQLQQNMGLDTSRGVYSS